MSLVVLLVVAALLYVGLMYLRTFQRMVDELREMRFKCIKSDSSASSSAAAASASPMNGGEFKNSLISMLSFMKEKAA